MKKILIPFLLLAALLTFINIGFALTGSTVRPNVKQLLADGDMEATNTQPSFANLDFEGAAGPPPASWSQFQAVATRVAGTRTGGSGSYVAHVAYDSTNASGLMYQNGLTAGHTYRVTGWYRTNGIHMLVMLGPSSIIFNDTAASWTYFDATGIQVGADNYLRFQSNDFNLGAGYFELDDVSITDVTAGSYLALAATVSKQTTNPHGGKQVLRVTADGTQTYGDSYQSILTEGKRYRVTGWARAGGSAAYPSIFFGGNSQVWSGSVSTAWQRFDVVGTTIGGPNLFLIAYGVTAAGQYVEFDDVTVTETTGYTQVQDKQSLVDGDMEGMPVALANGNFEGAAGPPPAGWSELSIAATRVAGARTGGIGSYVAQISYNGSGGGYLYQYSPFSVGKTYRVTGWARSVDGIAVPGTSDSSADGLIWTGTSTTTWQYFDYVGVSQSTGFMMSAVSLQAGGAVQFDDLSIVDIGTTAWGTVGSTLSKPTTNPHGGKQLLRVTADGSGAYGYAIQSGVLTIGKKYRVTGWARSDGAQVPRVYLGGSLLLWYGSTATTWQRIDATGVAAGNTILYLAQDTNNNGYVEFDDILVTEDKGKQQVIEKQIINDGDMEGLPAALVDGAMEATAASTTAGGAWTSYQSFISKKPGAPQSGSLVLRSVYDGVNASGGPFQIILTGGKTYHVTGWARGDGTATPYILIGGGSLNWSGTNSNTWQKIDVTVVADGNRLYLWGSLVSAGHYVEFDDISVVDVGTTAWSPGSSNATLTKTTTGQHGGKYALRAAWGAGTYVYASGGVIFTPGKPYRMTGWYRGDGVVTPTINMSGGQLVWTGIATTTWQKIDTTFTPLYNSLYLLYYSNGPAWVEWDDLYATLVQ